MRTESKVWHVSTVFHWWVCHARVRKYCELGSGVGWSSCPLLRLTGVRPTPFESRFLLSANGRQLLITARYEQGVTHSTAQSRLICLDWTPPLVLQLLIFRYLTGSASQKSEERECSFKRWMKLYTWQVSRFLVNPRKNDFAWLLGALMYAYILIYFCMYMNCHVHCIVYMFL